MNYSTLLKNSIYKERLTLGEIEEKLKNFGQKTNKAYISKLQNGKLPPAGDRLNEALAIVLNIDPIDLKAAAYREKIPAEVLERINSNNF
ncbi:XRE family transcriptional regulator [Paenibacillus graminis]|uniref:XRE family transcriptional regulator n=1 Tax=Paenibacillus graminis TaxID=189425 RepID=UPI002DBB6D11|nr:XRE family transcriptional regulator [Paenibacillus graminis]MEC0167418.1 XRE family transcriptional regulator [Paenibacillus graminis]